MVKLNNAEQLLLEAVDTMLQQDAKLGLKIHDKTSKKLNETERGLEYLHGQINEMFALKAAELTFADSVCQAFQKTHSYKYLDDPTFKTAMLKEMVAQAVPAKDRNKALEFIPSIIKELKEDKTEWLEKDFGFNPALDEVKDVSQPEQLLDFTIEEVDGWPTKENIKQEPGNASPGHISNN